MLTVTILLDSVEKVQRFVSTISKYSMRASASCRMIIFIAFQFFCDTNKFVAHVAGLVSLPSFRGLSACGGIFSASTSRKKDIKTNYV